MNKIYCTPTIKIYPVSANRFIATSGPTDIRVVGQMNDWGDGHVESVVDNTPQTVTNADVKATNDLW